MYQQRSFCEYNEGKHAARVFVIKEIYTKYYRRKFKSGNFRASWVPDPEELERIYNAANEVATDDKHQLITVSPRWNSWKGSETEVEQAITYIFESFSRLMGYKNVIGAVNDYAIEHRGTEIDLHGLHLHFWHANENGLAKSEIIRRVLAAFGHYAQSTPIVDVFKESIDVKVRPAASCISYISKNKLSDTRWGLGRIGRWEDDYRDTLQSVLHDVGKRFCALRDFQLHLEARDYAPATLRHPVQEADVSAEEELLSSQQPAEVCDAMETQAPYGYEVDLS